MLSEQIIEKLVERLVDRIEKGNTYVLRRIGENIKQIGDVSPSSVHKLGQILKYGGSFDEIVNELAKITELNVNDIYKIFDEVAKHDYQFAKQFYDYRGIDFIPYEQNIALQRQVKALAKITANEYVNISKTSVLGFSTKDIYGNTIFKGLKDAYVDAIDEAIISVAQGKDTFQQQMTKVLKELGKSGIKTVEYESGYKQRLDSAVRMNLKSALRNLHNETQKQFGEEFDADGVEISVHLNPAPDHADAQGRQFSNEQFEKLQTEGMAYDYKNKFINMHIPTKKGIAIDFRPISEYNCYHYTFAIVLGVNKPEYTNEKLKEINDNNQKGFEFEGKHYTNYEGTQLQRRLETSIRKAKDMQIMGKASGLDDIVQSSQQNITILSQKYNDLCKISGLPRKADRLSVLGYKKKEKSR